MSLIILAQPSGGATGGPSADNRGSTAITNGASSVAVVFGITFPSTPTVRVSVGRNSGDPLITADVDQNSITTAGFTAALSGSVPNANYKLHWEASA